MCDMIEYYMDYNCNGLNIEIQELNCGIDKNKNESTPLHHQMTLSFHPCPSIPTMNSCYPLVMNREWPTFGI